MVARDLTVAYAEVEQTIHVDEYGRVCLNHLVAYFPDKDLREYFATQAGQEMVRFVEKQFFNSGDSTELEFGSRGGIPSGLKSIKSKRGRYGGTYAHHIIAMDFAMWLDVRFRFKVMEAYQNGETWAEARVESKENNKIMNEAIKEKQVRPNWTDYSNNARMINKLVMGEHLPGQRDHLSQKKLQETNHLLSLNTTYLDMGMEYAERKDRLNEDLLRYRRRRRNTRRIEGNQSISLV